MRAGRGLERHRPVRWAAVLGAGLALLLTDGPAAASPTAHGSAATASSAKATGALRAAPAPSSAGRTLASARTASSLPSRVLPAASVTRIKFGSSAGEYRAREAVRLRGKVFAGKRAAGKGVKVQIWREKRNGKTKRIATVRTTKKGKFSYRMRPGAEASYQARAAGQRSAWVHLDKTSGDRSLKQRRATVRKQLGKPRGKTVRLSSAQVSDLGRSNISRVRYRDFAKGMLVEVRKSGSTRTWFVRGKIVKAYRKAGGPTGTYGVPFGDAKCGLLEKGCVQRFTGGSLYEKKSVKKASGQTGRSKATMVVAVARSQLSYRSGRTNSKFNTWAGSWGQPWCAAFVSWAASASGKKKAVPKFARLYQLAPYARNNMKTFTNSSKRKPKLGDLVFFDFRNGGRGPEPSHVGIVLKNKRNSVIAIEGNASRTSTFNPRRGVFIHDRPKSRVVFYASPDW